MGMISCMAEHSDVADDRPKRPSAEVRRQSLTKAAVASPQVIHLSNYRRRRRAKVGGPVVSLDNGIILQRSYTNVASVVSFVIYAGIMVRSTLRICYNLHRDHEAAWLRGNTLAAINKLRYVRPGQYLDG